LGMQVIWGPGKTAGLMVPARTNHVIPVFDAFSHCEYLGCHLMNESGDI